MKNVFKIFAKIFLVLASSLALAIAAALFFINYGGNRCGAVCDCFCCHMFGLRGYEACGQFGFWAGASLGLILGILLIWWLTKRKK